MDKQKPTCQLLPTERATYVDYCELTGEGVVDTGQRRSTVGLVGAMRLRQVSAEVLSVVVGELTNGTGVRLVAGRPRPPPNGGRRVAEIGGRGAAEIGSRQAAETASLAGQKTALTTRCHISNAHSIGDMSTRGLCHDGAVSRCPAYIQ